MSFTAHLPLLDLFSIRQKRNLRNTISPSLSLPSHSCPPCPHLFFQVLGHEWLTGHSWRGLLLASLSLSTTKHTQTSPLTNTHSSHTLIHILSCASRFHTPSACALAENVSQTAYTVCALTLSLPTAVFYFRVPRQTDGPAGSAE